MSFETEISTKEKFQNLLDICKSNFQMTDDEAKCFYLMMNRNAHKRNMGNGRTERIINGLPKTILELSKRLEDWEVVYTGSNTAGISTVRMDGYPVNIAMDRNKALMKDNNFINTFDLMLFDQKYNIKNIPHPPSKLTMARIFKFYKESGIPLTTDRMSLRTLNNRKFYPICESCEQIIAEHEQQKISQVFQNGTLGSGASKPKRRM
ncbi:hypothetical protein [Klebsiella pneumoniae]|uniref:hypothetical protein n=1 Tax=Klebsiella pneumoniae TaxID=573 RepID=UPI001CCBB332|nr:hypothetical protein [Klebsiella pneumoniae]UBN06019.1 hypothetical protein LB481_28440 [Klebsiella pneumoniae]